MIVGAIRWMTPTRATARFARRFAHHVQFQKDPSLIMYNSKKILRSAQDGNTVSFVILSEAKDLK